jgi:hypothetical protein
VFARPPAGGAVTERNASARKGARAGESGDLQVTLEHGRWRHFGWVVVGLLGGAFLLWKLGAVGKGAGVLLLGLAALNVFRFVRTLVRAPGVIDVREDAVRLPQALCHKDSHELPFDQIRHAFFLRRAVPWTRTGPILVIETAGRVFTYPRDWFASDSDQRRVALAINRRLGRL